jgi:hypothetical protein
LAQLSLDSSQATFRTNAFAPILLFKHLLPLLRGRHPCTVAARLLTQIDRRGPDASDSFWAWDDQPIAW